jgi:hypothetical protein
VQKVGDVETLQGGSFLDDDGTTLGEGRQRRGAQTERRLARTLDGQFGKSGNQAGRKTRNSLASSARD